MADNLGRFIITFVLAVALGALLTRFFIYLANKFRILDYPKAERKIHSEPIPLLGGSAIYLSFLLVVLFMWQNHQLLDNRLSGPMIIWFLLAGLILVINGIIDDKWSLPAYMTIWGPIMASILVIIGGLKIIYITNPNGGILYLNNVFSSIFSWQGADYSFAWLSIIITFLWLLATTYTTKLLDGIDGLTSSIGLVASLVIFVVSLSWDVVGSTTSILSLALAGSILGFLFFNWYPAKIFLGEGGSTFIGFSLGVLAIISGSKIATAILVMGLPLLDIIWVIARRVKAKRPIWRGDKNHLHFRLLDAGLSQRQVVIFFSIISLLFGLLSIIFTTKAKIGALIVVIVLMFIVSTWLNYRLKQNHV